MDNVVTHIRRNRPARSARSSERGATELFMLMLMTALLAFAGVAYDAGMAFNARREATNLAASAAREGANDVSTEALYSQGLTQLSPTAEDTARQALAADTRLTAEPDIYRLNESELYVEVELTHESVFLQIVGFDDFVVTGAATAQVQSEQ